MQHTVTFPWPPSRLFPNAKRRLHWSKYSGATKTYRALCFWETKAQAAALGRRNDPDPALRVGLTFMPPDRRKRDIDGMLGAFKAGLDGIADALRVDDSKFELSLTKGDVVKGGAVVALIEVIV